MSILAPRPLLTLLMLSIPPQLRTQCLNFYRVEKVEIGPDFDCVTLRFVFT